MHEKRWEMAPYMHLATSATCENVPQCTVMHIHLTAIKRLHDKM
jgi:hypothetical protein